MPFATAAASIRSISFRINCGTIVGVKSRGLSAAILTLSQGEAMVLCAMVSSMRFHSSPALRPSVKASAMACPVLTTIALMTSFI